MNDDKLLTEVKEPFTGVHMNIPVEQIVRRGRAVRAGRRIPGVAGALAVVAAAATTLTMLLPPTGHQPASSARLTSWTVTKQPDGRLVVVFWSLRDPSGLERKLRAYGVPASVTVHHVNPACHRYTGPPPKHTLTENGISERGASKIVFDPESIPSGAGLQIAVELPYRGGGTSAIVGLVQASPRCTGS